MSLNFFSVRQAAQEGFLEGAFLQTDENYHQVRQALYVPGDDHVTVLVGGEVRKVWFKGTEWSVPATNTCLVPFPVKGRHHQPVVKDEPSDCGCGGGFCTNPSCGDQTHERCSMCYRVEFECSC